MKKLYIETNHGHVTLTDVTIVQHPRTWGDCKGTYAVAEGTVESSSETSRLLWATSTREKYPAGSRVEYAVYRDPYCVNKDADEWRVSTVSCG